MQPHEPTEGEGEVEVEAEARRRWDLRERGFPAFTRMRWEDGTEVARSITLDYARASLRETATARVRAEAGKEG